MQVKCIKDDSLQGFYFPDQVKILTVILTVGAQELKKSMLSLLRYKKWAHEHLFLLNWNVLIAYAEAMLDHHSLV